MRPRSAAAAISNVSNSAAVVVPYHSVRAGREIHSAPLDQQDLHGFVADGGPLAGAIEGEVDVNRSLSRGARQRGGKQGLQGRPVELAAQADHHHLSAMARRAAGKRFHSQPRPDHLQGRQATMAGAR